VAGLLAPASPEAQLARAEGLLLFDEDRETGLELLARLATGEGVVAERAVALRTASGA
jgi:non-ribosomal peptide synthetase component F